MNEQQGLDTPPAAIRDDLAVYFGPRGQAYLAYFDQRGDKIGTWFRWSWPAFSGWIVWAWYRKLGPYVLVALALPVLSEYCVPVLGGLAGLAVFAMVAKEAYLRTALQTLRAADRLGLAGDARTDFLRRKGGVSLAAGAGATLLVLAFGVLWAYQLLEQVLLELDGMGLLQPGY